MILAFGVGYFFFSHVGWSNGACWYESIQRSLRIMSGCWGFGSVHKGGVVSVSV